MINVRYGKPINQCRTKQSAFLSFRYDEFIISKIKELNIRHYIPDTKEWEIPSTLVEKVTKICPIQLINEPDYNSKQFIDPGLFKTKPLDHQIEGINYGLEVNSWLLGDQQGLGKTKQIIDLAVQRKATGELKHCLIICGINNLKYNWVEEINKHSDEKSCILGKQKLALKTEPSFNKKVQHLASKPDEFFWITNVESLRFQKVETEASKKRTDGSKKTYHLVSEFLDLLNFYISSGELGLIVVDEIHKCKNPSSLQGKGLLSLKGCSKIGMSGTLLVNRPSDLFVPLTFVEAIQNNYFQFQNKYFIKDQYGGVIGYKNMADLQEIMDQNMLRRTKDILDLPPKLYTTEYLEMCKEETKLYGEILEATKRECDLIDDPVEKLAKIVRMRQVCCHTGLVSSTVFKSSKFVRLYDILNDARDNNEKVIVFSSFKQVIELALEEFEYYNPLHIWGGMDEQTFNYNRQSFQEREGFQVIFGVIQAMGTGITLNEANTVVFLDLPWNSATKEQAEDRAHRIGTKKTVNIITLLMKGSYDEMINKVVYDKQAMGDMLVDGSDIKQSSKLLDMIFKGKGEYDYE